MVERGTTDAQLVGEISENVDMGLAHLSHTSGTNFPTSV